MSKLEEAKVILRDIGMPSKQQNDLCAYTLLALLNIKNEGKWNDATNEYIRIHDIMEFIKKIISSYMLRIVEKLLGSRHYTILEIVH